MVCGPPSRAEEQPLACVKELTMPHFSGVMIRQVPAEIQVSVVIGADGKPRSIDLKPNDTPLRFELLDDFGAGAAYSRDCRGRRIVFVVRYVYRGEPTDRPLWDVKLEPPNEILVICRPLLPKLN
jgi:hypothetical protein